MRDLAVSVDRLHVMLFGAVMSAALKRGKIPLLIHNLLTDRSAQARPPCLKGGNMKVSGTFCEYGWATSIIIIPLLPAQLNEKLIDGASLVHSTVEAHNCVQLRRWLKCHERPQEENKTELFERIKNALRNCVLVDPSLDKGKWLKLEVKKRK